MSVFTMVALIAVTAILAKAWRKTRGGTDRKEVEQLKLENESLRRRLDILEHRFEEMHLLEDLSGDRALALEIERAAQAPDGSVARPRP